MEILIQCNNLLKPLSPILTVILRALKRSSSIHSSTLTPGVDWSNYAVVQAGQAMRKKRRIRLLKLPALGLLCSVERRTFRSSNLKVYSILKRVISTENWMMKIHTVSIEAPIHTATYLFDYYHLSWILNLLPCNTGYYYVASRSNNDEKSY